MADRGWVVVADRTHKDERTDMVYGLAVCRKLRHTALFQLARRTGHMLPNPLRATISTLRIFQHERKLSCMT